MFRLAVLVVAAYGLLAPEARAVIFMILHDENDDREAIAAVKDEPAVKESRQRMDAFIDRLRPLKEKDIVALFGKPLSEPAGKFAMPVAQPRGLALSGIRYADEKMNKDHTASYKVGDFARIEVYYHIDGESPGAILLYFRADEKFPKLTKDNLDKRLEWEQERLKKLVVFYEKRRAAVFVWEVDPDEEKKLYQGIDSGDLDVKLKAMIRWGEQQGYRLDAPHWRWYQSDKLMAQAVLPGGPAGAKGKPSRFTVYRPDGTEVRDDMGWPSIQMVRWYRSNKSMIRYEGGSLLKESWRPTRWSWYKDDDTAIRSEWDSNGDGVPDTYREGELYKKEPNLPLAVEQSWAVHPELIPEEFRIPGQSERRVPLRKIKQ